MKPYPAEEELLHPVWRGQINALASFAAMITLAEEATRAC